MKLKIHLWTVIIGVLIPQDITGIIEFQTTAKYILVVEKDAIFQKLLDEGALVRLGPVIVITVSEVLVYFLSDGLWIYYNRGYMYVLL